MLRALVELLIPSVCPCCDRERRPEEPLLCAECAPGLQRRAFCGALPTALAYQGTAARLIQRFKFERRRDALRVLLDPLCARVAELDVDLVIPVPRPVERVREQQSDPVHELARALTRRTGLALDPHALERRGGTRPQMGLTRARRLTNPRDSFALRADSLAGRSVLLLDDVTTTGATLRAATAALAEARPRQLTPLALAGTPAL